MENISVEPTTPVAEKIIKVPIGATTGNDRATQTPPEVTPPVTVPDVKKTPEPGEQPSSVPPAGLQPAVVAKP
jgi:hypothetical protein